MSLFPWKYAAAGAGALLIVVGVLAWVQGARLELVKAELRAERISHEVSRASLRELQGAVNQANDELAAAVKRIDLHKLQTKEALEKVSQADKTIQSIQARLEASAKVNKTCKASEAVEELWL